MEVLQFHQSVLGLVLICSYIHMAFFRHRYISCRVFCVASHFDSIDVKHETILYTPGELIGIENILLDVVKLDAPLLAACAGSKNETFVNVSEIKSHAPGIRATAGVDEHVLVPEVNEAHSEGECNPEVTEIGIKQTGTLMMPC